MLSNLLCGFLLVRISICTPSGGYSRTKIRVIGETTKTVENVTRGCCEGFCAEWIRPSIAAGSCVLCVKAKTAGEVIYQVYKHCLIFGKWSTVKVGEGNELIKRKCLRGWSTETFVSLSEENREHAFLVVILQHLSNRAVWNSRPSAEYWCII